MYCKNCGGKIKDSYNYCIHCGQNLKENNALNEYPENHLGSRQDSNIAYDSTNGVLYIKPLGIDIYFGGYEDNILDENEYCIFVKEDVAWYEINPRYDVFDCDACGTLYLTNKNLFLYDEGFSNFWTRMSKDGDYPEQVKAIPIMEIEGIVKNKSGELEGPFIQSRKFDCWLPPSQRKYRGRRNPIVTHYSDMEDMVRLIISQQALIRSRRRRK